MLKLSRLLIIGFLLALLCLVVQSSPAHAHTNSVTFGPPSRAYAPYATTTYLKRGQWGNYYFAPTYVSIETDALLVIVNRTGSNVMLTNNMRFAGVLVRGGAYRTSFYSGVYRFNDIQHNIRVPLTITVVGGYWRAGGSGRGYPGRQY